MLGGDDVTVGDANAASSVCVVNSATKCYASTMKEPVTFDSLTETIDASQHARDADLSALNTYAKKPRRALFAGNTVVGMF